MSPIFIMHLVKITIYNFHFVDFKLEIISHKTTHQSLYTILWLVMNIFSDLFLKHEIWIHLLRSSFKNWFGLRKTKSRRGTKIKESRFMNCLMLESKTPFVVKIQWKNRTRHAYFTSQPFNTFGKLWSEIVVCRI